MKDYIEKIYNLESDLIKYKTTKELIDNEISDIEQYKENYCIPDTTIIERDYNLKLCELTNYNEKEPSKPSYEFVNQNIKDSIISAMIFVGSIILTISIVFFKLTRKIIFIVLLVLMIYFLFKFGKYLISEYENKIKEKNDKKREDYNFKMELYETRKNYYLEQQKTKIDELNNEYSKLIEIKENINNKIIEEYNLLIKELRKIRKEETRMEISAKNKLKRLYEKNIIFPKYRNISPISSFHEYFQTGRVTSLDGSTGAYNLFENDVRSNAVYLNIIFNYEDISQTSKKYQYYLKETLKDTNKYLNNKIKIISNLKDDTKKKIQEIKED